MQARPILFAATTVIALINTHKQKQYDVGGHTWPPEMKLQPEANKQHGKRTAE